METEDIATKKNKSKAILIIILSVLLICVIIGTILLAAKPWEEHKNVTYEDNPELFCEQNPENVLCGDEEISYWDDPVSYCLKNPDVDECEKRGDVDYCKNNPSSPICDSNPDNDYDWIDDSFNDAFKNFGLGEDTASAYKDVFIDSMKDLTACLNAAGLHIDSMDAYESLAKDENQFDSYNAAQMLKISECTSQFGNKFSTSQANE